MTLRPGPVVTVRAHVDLCAAIVAALNAQEAARAVVAAWNEPSYGDTRNTVENLCEPMAALATLLQEG